MWAVTLFRFQWQHEKCSTAAFFFGPGLLQFHRVAAGINKRLKGTKKYFVFFKKLQGNKLITLIGCISVWNGPISARHCSWWSCWITFGLSYEMTALYIVMGSLNVGRFKYFNNGMLKIFIPDIVRNSSYLNIISSIVLLCRIHCCFKNYDFVL